MIKAQVLTKWISDETGNHVPLTDFLQSGDSAMDVTGQSAVNIVPDPNAVVWEVWVGSETTLTSIGSDPDHTVLWSEVIDEG